MQQPADDDSAGKKQKNQERQRHVKSPEKESHFDDCDVLNHEDNRKTSEYCAEDNLEMHRKASSADDFCGLRYVHDENMNGKLHQPTRHAYRRHMASRTAHARSSVRHDRARSVEGAQTPH
jgi:hypothetical protein